MKGENYLCRTDSWLVPENLPGEEWRYIDWLEITALNFYYVSNLGRVKRFVVKDGTFIILKPSPDTKGYCRVNINFGDYVKSLKVHRLVATAFVPNKKKKPNLDHIDGDKGNNLASNLRWVTTSENNHNPVTRARFLKKMEAKRRGCPGKMVTLEINGRRVKTYKSLTDAARSLGLSPANLCNHLRNGGQFETFFCGKFATLRYADEKKTEQLTLF